MASAACGAHDARRQTRGCSGNRTACCRRARRPGGDRAASFRTSAGVSPGIKCRTPSLTTTSKGSRTVLEIVGHLEPCARCGMVGHLLLGRADVRRRDVDANQRRGGQGVARRRSSEPVPQPTSSTRTRLVLRHVREHDVAHAVRPPGRSGTGPAGVLAGPGVRRHVTGLRYARSHPTRTEPAGEASRRRRASGCEGELVRSIAQMVEESPIRAEHARAAAEPPLAVRQEHDDAAGTRATRSAHSIHIATISSGG